LSPPSEHIVSTNPSHPWWQRYQPVSYQLNSRSGNRAAFADMVSRCNNVGVRVYADIVVNHMAAAGIGTGYGGSSYDSGSLSYPGVPFGPNDFNGPAECSTSSGNIENYGDANQVRNCRLLGMPDLALGKDYVRGKVADYLNDLIGLGVAGFRIDAAKHMWPGDLAGILGRLNNLNTQWFSSGKQPFVFHEVIDLGGEPIKGSEYKSMGRVTEFKYGKFLGKAFRGRDQLKWLETFGQSWGMLHPFDALVFIDNHDNQRGEGGGGMDTIVTFFESRPYKMASAFMLAHPYGLPRVMSSYHWDRHIVGGEDHNYWIGPPHNEDWSTKDVIVNADGTCGNGWVCEHRWRQIANMVAFRNACDGEEISNWWDNGNNQIAFSRGNKGFIAINNDGNGLDATLQTGLPAGLYCDVISGDFVNRGCSGHTISVDGSGIAHISISNSAEDPFIAIHVGAKIGENGGNEGRETQPPAPAPTPGEGWARTVVFIKKQTQYGQDLFVRGGISHAHRTGCSQDAATSACAIPIAYNDLGDTDHLEKFNAWRGGDSRLDWYGPEQGQGTFGSKTASGSPTVWTTNIQGEDGYFPENRFGEHYWMLDINMDCSKTEGGWFDIKSYLSDGSGGFWEADINQVTSCGGSAGGQAPYSSKNHVARCGYINVFEFGSGSCIIDN
ncbi:pancreatic alpha-amylase, partial [Lingula anatina]|uniref:Alpha-amylase n=1 Tax=Lingula anatina TaxID=7574 RepID=A0A1S3HXK6_LINAN